ncbi:MAG: T9SS type A sorting domain-containing protein, partial [Calditrichia bacterium]|nr:T9SS type A sorting domain-containing protein [Calditrichia bacterium]
FYPYKNMMDKPWDESLSEVIPGLMNAPDLSSYHLQLLRFTKRIDDTHAFTQSAYIWSNIWGEFYFPFVVRLIENETVITRVFSDSLGISPGDVIKEIDGIDIYVHRDSLRKNVAGSNDSGIERTVNRRFVSGSQKNVDLLIENDSGQNRITVMRYLTKSEYYDLESRNGQAWEKVTHGDYTIGLVYPDILENKDIESMFVDLHSSDGLIFDFRRYPNFIVYDLIRFLFDSPVEFCKYLIPLAFYTGAFFWSGPYPAGEGDFSYTYQNNICILINEHTISRGEHTAMVFEQYPRLIKIGSQTAGANGDVAKIYLPGGITTNMSGAGVYYPGGETMQRIGIIPDIEVKPTITGIRSGKDELLAAALNSLTHTLIKENGNPNITKTIEIDQNYPNPFNPETTIPFDVPEEMELSLKIYNVLGQEVKTLYEGRVQPGRSFFSWDGKNYAGKNVPGGVYIYSVKLKNGQRYSKKMILMK